MNRAPSTEQLTHAPASAARCAQSWSYLRVVAYVAGSLVSIANILQFIGGQVGACLASVTVRDSHAGMADAPCLLARGQTLCLWLRRSPATLPATWCRPTRWCPVRSASSSSVRPQALPACQPGL